MRSVKINLPVRQAGTINLAILFFSLFLTLAVFSQISAANPKPTYDVGLNKADWLYYKTNNDLSAYLGKKSSNLPTVRYQKAEDYLEFSMTGVSSTTFVSLETNVKTPNTPTLFYRNVFDGADANYQITNIPFKIKEEIILKETFPTSHVGKGADLKFLFSAETNAKPVKQDDGSIAFFDNKGEYLFQLDKPFMVDGRGIISNDVSIEIKPTSDVGLRRTNKTKIASEETIFGDSNLEQKSGLPPINNQYRGIKSFVNRLYAKYVDNKKVLDLGGIEPPESWIASQTPHQARPRTGLVYHKPTPVFYQIILKASSDWLNDPSRVYPVVIDPTVTHNADANFTGQFNRIADSDSTSSTQLESSYPEATKDPHTVLLLHFNEANGATSGIRDYASTTRVITANGNASTTSYVTQFGLGNSAAFDGAGDYLSAPDDASLDFAAADNFTIDFWIKHNTIATNPDYAITKADTTTGGYKVYMDASGDMCFDIDDDATWTPDDTACTSGIDYDDSVWHHIAGVKTGTTKIELFVDGVLVASDSALAASGTLANTNGLYVGMDRDGSSNGWDGQIDESRVIGRAITVEEIKAAASRRPYAVYTSPVVDAAASVQWDTLNWTEGGVNTGNGEQPYNTGSLVAQWDFNDTSGTTLTASSSGSCTTACNGTLTNFAYTASQDQATTTTGWTANNKKWGAGSLMFESVNAPDYISIADPASNALDPGTGDFSVEGWIKSSAAGQDTIIQNNTTVGACASNAGYVLIVNGNRNLAAYASDGTTCYVNNLAANASSTEIADGRWHHFAFVADRDTKAYVYYDGRLATSTTINNTTAANPAATIYFGASGATGDSDFILDSARFYSRALSASEILSNYNAGNIEVQTRTGATSDPNDGTWEAWKPTTGETQLLSMDSDQSNWNAPQQVDGYTKLLLHMDGADTATTFPNSATTTHTVTAVNQAQVDTAQSKFSGASGLFDGTGDGVRVDGNADFAFAADFTIDTWIRTTSTANMHFYGTTNESAWTTDAWHMGYFNGNLVFGVFTNANTQTFASGSLHDGNWHHIAITRSGTTIRMFADGVEKGSFTDSRTLGNATFRNAVGAQDPTMSSETWNGHIDEFRISKGIARWTSNFTPPPRAYGSNVKADNETTLKQEGTGSAKLTLGAPQVDGNTVALWHFEETGTTTGTYLYDETANNNDATTTGTTVVDGIFGKARKFNGTSDYVDAGNGSGFNFSTTSAFSIESWIKTPSTSLHQVIISRRDVIGGNATGYFFSATDASGESRLLLQLNSDNGGWKYRYGNKNIADGQWHYLVGTYTGGGTLADMRLYVDGIEQTYTSAEGSTLSSMNNSGNLLIGKRNDGLFFNGNIDEVKISNRALSADEIAETYRMGANHHLTRQVSAVDLSAQTKLAFNVAADRPGTYLETMLGESDYANYELASSTLALSTNTVLYIKGDEIASSTSIKDSSFSGKAITANGNARTAGGGKIGNSMYFDGTGDYLSLADSADWNFGSGDFSIDFWVKTAVWTTDGDFMGQYVDNNNWWSFGFHSVNGPTFIAIDGGVQTVLFNQGNTTGFNANNWYYMTIVRSGNNWDIYKNGISIVSTTDSSALVDLGAILLIGDGQDGSTNNVYNLNGHLDETRVIKGTALSADQIRQAYEYGLRTHPITIDFGATLQSSDLISSATDYNFSLTATTSGLSATTSGLYLGDKIIIKENLGGTEYTAQGTVNAINTTTGAITVPSWDTGSTFPASNGYSPNATVFKWQREYFDMTGAATTTRDAITNLTLRPTNGAEGRTIYLDDFRYNTNYLTASSSSAITSSNNRYLQYRTIFSSWDSFVSPYLSAINTLYTAAANSFPAIIGISGGGFLSF